MEQILSRHASIHAAGELRFWTQRAPAVIDANGTLKPSAATALAREYQASLKGMANGKPFDPSALTCASWAYPLGTRLRVTNTATGASIVVTVADRGPAKRLVAQGRVIDLARAAFEAIGQTKAGLVPVRVDRL